MEVLESAVRENFEILQNVQDRKTGLQMDKYHSSKTRKLKDSNIFKWTESRVVCPLKKKPHYKENENPVGREDDR